MKRLRNSKGQFISRNAEEGIRQISNEHGVKGTDNIQQYFIQNENEFRGLFTATHDALFSTENSEGYLNRNFNSFTINNGEETFKVSRAQAANLVAQFQRYQLRERDVYKTLITGEMKDKNKEGSFDKLEIKLPIKKTKSGSFRVDKNKLEEMIENEEITETTSPPKGK